MTPTVPEDQIRKIVFAYHHDPFQVLGAHQVEVDGRAMVAVRAFLPEAREAFVVDDADQTYELARIHDHGFFEAVFDRQDVFKYQLKIQYRVGDMYAPKLDDHEALALETTHFVECLQNNTQPITNGRAGLEVVKILAASNKSLEENGAPIDL